MQKPKFAQQKTKSILHRGYQVASGIADTRGQGQRVELKTGRFS